MQPDAMFCFINCNRLFYLRSTVESFIETKQLTNERIIVIDNASVEEGTLEYIKSLEDRGIKVIRRIERDPKVEFAHALNKAYDMIDTFACAIIPADTQFVATGEWLHEFVDMLKDERCCSIVLDAQRNITNVGHAMQKFNDSFFIDANRYKVSPWGSLTRKEHLAHAFPCCTSIDASGLSSLEENTVRTIERNMKGAAFVPTVPVSITIWNDQGSQAKVRYDKRYGKYVEAVDGIHYYEMYRYDQMRTKRNAEHPMLSIPIENAAKTIGWTPLFDKAGNWVKVLLNVENCEQFESTPLVKMPIELNEVVPMTHIDEWLNDE